MTRTSVGAWLIGGCRAGPVDLAAWRSLDGAALSFPDARGAEARVDSTFVFLEMLVKVRSSSSACFRFADRDAIGGVGPLPLTWCQLPWTGRS
jgi:hypothetical protein